MGIFLGLSERIRKVRGRLSQEEFGCQIGGLQKSTVSRYEKGRIPDEETLNKIATFGNVTMEWLLKGDERQTLQFSEPAPEVRGARPGPPLDVALLAEILAEIKKFIAEERLELSSKREARWVALVYDQCQDNKVKPDRMLVKRFLWITKVD
jgi:transcriptional regulator with XRE-family HTH domain